MSVTSHLKDLLTKMGGTPKNGDSTSVLIDKIEDVYNGSGGGSGDGPGSSGNFVVTIYADTAEDMPNTAEGIEVQLKMNKTVRQIIAAYDNNVPVTLIFDGMKKYDLSIFEGIEGFDNTYTVFLPRVNNSEHLNTLQHTKDDDSNITIVSSGFVNEYGGGNDNFGYYAIQLSNLDFSCEKELNVPYYTCIFQSSDGSYPFLQTGFTCENLDDYPTLIISFNSGEY